MKRKALSWLLALCLLVGLLPTAALAVEGGTADEQGTQENPWNISADGEGNSVSAYVVQNSDGETYTLHFAGNGVIKDYAPAQGSDGSWAYATTPWGTENSEYHGRITSVEFDDGSQITKIGVACFYGESLLTNIEIPESITELGDRAFAATGLTSITLPNTVTKCGDNLFHGCKSLISAKIENGDLSAGKNMFLSCTALETVTLPEGMTSIPQSFLSGCTKISTINLPSSIAAIGLQAFNNCTSLATITIPSGTVTIGVEVFQKSGLTELTISESATVSERAFKNCASLQKVTFNANKIPQSAFEGCNNLSAVVLGDNVSEIGTYAFKDCTALKELTLPAGTKTASNAGCASIHKITVKDGTDNNSYGTIVTNQWGTAYEGGTLIGWYTASGTLVSGTDHSLGTHKNQSGTFYAVFSNTVTFESNGGSGTISDSITGYFAPGLAGGTTITISDKTCALPSEGFTLNGYTLSGWNTKADGSGTSYETGASVSISNQQLTTLYAQWTPNTYTISFSGGSGAGGSTASVTATYDQSATLTANGFTLTGKNFAGWATTENATTATYSDGATVENLTTEANGSVTLYAVWTEKQVLTPDKSVQTKTYNGDPQAFTLDGFTVSYKQDGQDVTSPTNVGSYDVVISHAGNETYAPYPSTTISGGLVITPATLTAPVLTNYTATTTSITVTAPTVPTGASKVQYSIDNGTNWQDSNVFSGLSSGTSYSVTAKFVADTSGNYVDSANSAALSARTNSSGGGGGGGTTTYAVAVDSAKNGSVSVSPKNASKGTTVTITVKPDSGYELDDLAVTDKNGDAVKLTRKSDTQYTFTMPASKVTVEASFTKIEEQPAVSFVDVPTSAYYYDAVAWAVENGITNGTSATTFSPDASCTRAQMVTFLWRAAGSPKTTGGNPFTDVSANAYYYEAVLWAVENGITNGTSATTFSPDATVTRGQTVTFLWRAGGSPAASGSSFADVAADAYYAPAVQWAVANGITNGTSSTTFSPDNACTRGQIVTFMYRDAR